MNLGFNWKFLLGMLLLGTLGFLVAGSPQPVDLATEFYPAIGQFLIFTFWFVGMLGWGDWILSRLQPEILPQRSSSRWAVQLSLGSVAASAFVGSASLLFPYGPWAKFWASALVVLGILRLAIRPKEKLRISFSRFDPWARVIAGVIALAIVMRFIEAFRLIRTGDPYIVYLTGPRLWFDAHGFGPFLDNPIQFLCSTWEYLFQWGNFFLAGDPGSCLDATQRFAQWTTVWVGYAGLALATYSVLTDEELENAKTGKVAALLATLAAISIPALITTSTQAKNDMGVCFWSMAALIPLFNTSSPSAFRNAFIGGLLLGASVMGKPPSVVFAFFAASFAMIRLFRTSRLKSALQATGWLTLGGGIAASPILIRNGVLTGNPFFPWLDSVFRSGLTGPTLTRGFGVPTAHELKPTAFHYWSYLQEMIWNQPFILASLLCLIPVLGSRVLKIPSRLRWLAAVGWSSALLFIWKLRPATELRYLGPALPLLAGLGIISTFHLLLTVAKVVRRSWFISLGTSLLALFLIATSGIPLHVLKRIPKGYFISSSQDVLEHEGGGARRWMRQNVHQNELILGMGDNYFYYTLGLNYIDMHHFKPTDDAFLQTKKAKEMVALMKHFKARYFHHLLSIGGWIYAELKPELARLKVCRVYEDSQAHIYDVDCLNREMN